MIRNPQDFSFPKECRLLRQREFQEISKAEKRVGRHLSLKCQLNATQALPKLGITVTKRFGKAHERNLFKRQIREVFRKNRTTFSPHISIEVRPKGVAEGIDYQQIKKEFVSLLQEFTHLKQALPDPQCIVGNV